MQCGGMITLLLLGIPLASAGENELPTTVDMESGVVTLKRTKGFQSGTKFTIDNIVGSGVAEITLTSGQATDIIPVQVKPPSLDLTLDGNKLLFIDSESEDQEIELQQVDMATFESLQLKIAGAGYDDNLQLKVKLPESFSGVMLLDRNLFLWSHRVAPGADDSTTALVQGKYPDVLKPFGVKIQTYDGTKVNGLLNIRFEEEIIAVSNTILAAGKWEDERTKSDNKLKAGDKFKIELEFTSTTILEVRIQAVQAVQAEDECMLVLGRYNVNDGVRYVKLYDEVLSSGTWNFKEDVEPPRTVQFFPTSQEQLDPETYIWPSTSAFATVNVIEGRYYDSINEMSFKIGDMIVTLHRNCGDMDTKFYLNVKVGGHSVGNEEIFDLHDGKIIKFKLEVNDDKLSVSACVGNRCSNNIELESISLAGEQLELICSGCLAWRYDIDMELTKPRMEIEMPGHVDDAVISNALGTVEGVLSVGGVEGNSDKKPYRNPLVNVGICLDQNVEKDQLADCLGVDKDNEDFKWVTDEETLIYCNDGTNRVRCNDLSTDLLREDLLATMEVIDICAINPESCKENCMFSDGSCDDSWINDVTCNECEFVADEEKLKILQFGGEEVQCFKAQTTDTTSLDVNFDRVIAGDSVADAAGGINCRISDDRKDLICELTGGCYGEYILPLKSDEEAEQELEQKFNYFDNFFNFKYEYTLKMTITKGTPNQKLMVSFATGVQADAEWEWGTERIPYDHYYPIDSKVVFEFDQSDCKLPSGFRPGPDHNLPWTRNFNDATRMTIEPGKFETEFGHNTNE